jgi:hypothetical protein
MKLVVNPCEDFINSFGKTYERPLIEKLTYQMNLFAIFLLMYS